MKYFFFFTYYYFQYFCGFSGRSVRNICEQIDNTEIQPEVYGALAEDATYKCMELINVSYYYACFK